MFFKGKDTLKRDFKKNLNLSRTIISFIKTQISGLYIMQSTKVVGRGGGGGGGGGEGVGGGGGFQCLCVLYVIRCCNVTLLICSAC